MLILRLRKDTDELELVEGLIMDSFGMDVKELWRSEAAVGKLMDLLRANPKLSLEVKLVHAR